MLAKEHAAVFEPGDHGNTFGGNPLATAAGTYVLRQLLDGGVMDNVRARSEQLRQRIESLADRNEDVKGVRGSGLLLGVELDRDISADVVVAGVQRGILMNPVRPDVVRLMPPLTITQDEVDRGVELLELAIRDVLSK